MTAISPRAFFGKLYWIDGRPLLDTMEEYRLAFLTKALFTLREDEKTPVYNLVLAGRGKKNWKSTDLVLAALYCVLIRETSAGNDALIVTNAEDQAGDDLSLMKKLVAANPDTLGRELHVMQKEIKRVDGKGSIKILPSQDAIGLHGKTYAFLGLDEIHGIGTTPFWRRWRPTRRAPMH